MNAFLTKVRLIFTDAALMRRLGFVVAMLVVFRLLATIPIPGVNELQLAQFFSNSQLLGILNVFSGGGLSNLSIMMLGVGPYITASIIMQLATILYPPLKAMYQEEGEMGRKRFAQYSRLLTVPLATIQAFAFLILLERQGIVPALDLFSFATNVLVVAAGSVFLMWVGELITEFGIGNGVSLIIFAGIVAALPSTLSQLAFSFDATQVPLYLGFTVAALAIIAGVVLVTEAERPIPVTYAKRVRGMKVYGGISTYLPLRVNQAGVIPIIFALSILLFPQMILNFLAQTGGPLTYKISSALLAVLANGWVYAGLYFVLVFLFTYFYTAVTFDPDSIANNLQKSGAFVPGVRPGVTTSQYLAKIITRITLVGAVFLGAIAVLPLAVQAVTGIAALAIGGTALLIVISVALDFVRRVDAQLSLREY